MLHVAEGKYVSRGNDNRGSGECHVLWKRRLFCNVAESLGAFYYIHIGPQINQDHSQPCTRQHKTLLLMLVSFNAISR